MTKHQYYCPKCNYHRRGLLDHPAIGIGSYSTECPECHTHYASYEVPNNAVSFSECDCGCNIPVATTPEEMLKFLAGRMDHAGISDSVAAIYARDIRYVLAKGYNND